MSVLTHGGAQDKHGLWRNRLPPPTVERRLGDVRRETDDRLDEQKAKLDRVERAQQQASSTGAQLNEMQQRILHHDFDVEQRRCRRRLPRA